MLIILNKIVNTLINIAVGIYHLFKGIVSRFFIFFVLLNFYLVQTFIIVKLIKIPFLPKAFVSKMIGNYSGFYYRILEKFDPRLPGRVSKTDLIELAIKNMFAKKIRTGITIGGVSIGFGAIVFLVSIGYGLQELVIRRVARLDELKQADVSSQVGSKIKISDKTLTDIKNLQGVSEVIPLIAVVGRVNYQNSVSDMAVYGVTTTYLKSSAIKPVQGKVFESDSLSITMQKNVGQVAGVADKKIINTLRAKIGDAEFEINPGEWVRVRNGPSVDSKIIGYTKRTEGTNFGDEVWGEEYISDSKAGISGVDEKGNKMGKWLKAQVPLWKQGTCEKENPDCVEGKYLLIKNENGTQLQKEGYFAEVNLNVKNVSYIGQEPAVLGDYTEEIDLGDVLAQTVESTQSTMSFNITNQGDTWVEIPDEAGIVKAPETQKVSLSTKALKQAVVNRAMLRVLGINENEAVGKKFKSSFIIPRELITTSDSKVESTEDEYEIVGVVPSEDAPYFYVPFIDLRSLGITNYSQLKLVSSTKEVLSRVRTQVEAMGFMTQSVADTVAQINSLFATLRIVLGVMGMIALSVAALGMFNTFTVSLLERTREVGLMKAMGMRSDEVQELFLTESMIMGFWGGILGLFVGFLAGKLLGLLLSAFAMFKGVGYIDVSYIPMPFVLLIVVLSLIVGVGTGVYPAMRARKISALNALRYE